MKIEDYPGYTRRVPTKRVVELTPQEVKNAILEYIVKKTRDKRLIKNATDPYTNLRYKEQALPYCTMTITYYEE